MDMLAFKVPLNRDIDRLAGEKTFILIVECCEREPSLKKCRNSIFEAQVKPGGRFGWTDDYRTTAEIMTSSLGLTSERFMSHWGRSNHQGITGGGIGSAR